MGQVNYSAAKAGDDRLRQGAGAGERPQGHHRQRRSARAISAPRWCGRCREKVLEDEDPAADPGRPARRGRGDRARASSSSPPTRPASSPARRCRSMAASIWPEDPAPPSGKAPSKALLRPRAFVSATPMTTRTATFIGFTAILLWSPLALFTAASGKVPPFQLAAMTFAVGAPRHRGSRRPRAARQARPTRAGLALGLYGLFGDHGALFRGVEVRPAGRGQPRALSLAAADRAVRRAPARRAARAAPSRRRAIGLAATALLVGRGASAARARMRRSAIACALLGAFVWASYSVALAPLRRGADRDGRGDLPRRDRALPRSAISSSRRRSGRRR